MPPEIIVDQATPGEDGVVIDTPETPPAPSQEDPKKEPEKKFTKRERLEFTKAKIEKQIEDLDNEEDDNRPLTVGDLKKMQREQAKETALELASAIEDQVERDEVVSILETRIVPSGDPQADLKLAQEMVNARKNAQLAEEALRKQDPKQHGSRPGAPGYTPDAFTPTAEELTFMQPPYNLTKEQIIAARNKTQ